MEYGLLASLAEPDRRRLLARGRRRRFSRREVIFHAGDPGNALHLIEYGHVAVRIHTPLGDVVTLAILGPGDTFGELSLLREDAVRAGTVVALDRTDTWSLTRDQFEALRATGPAIDRFIIDLLATYVRRVDQQLVEALYLPADKRVVRRLAELARLYNGDIALTQEDLASLAGTSRATVNRVLRQLEQAGHIVLTRGRVLVPDPRRLRTTKW